MCADKSGSADEIAPFRLAPGFGARIEEAASAIGPKKAAQAMGRSYPQLRKIIREEQAAGFESVFGLAFVSGYRVEWIATGQEPKRPALYSDAHFLPVPEIELEFSGTGEKTKLGEPFPVPRPLVDAIPAGRALAVIKLRGDGVWSRFRGDVYALVDRTGPMFLREGGLFAFRFGDDVVARRVRMEVDGGVTLTADDPQVQSRAFSAEQVRELRSKWWIQGEVIGVLGRL